MKRRASRLSTRDRNKRQETFSLEYAEPLFPVSKVIIGEYSDFLNYSQMYEDSVAAQDDEDDKVIDALQQKKYNDNDW